MSASLVVGRVVQIMNDGAHVRPSASLPRGYPENCDIYLPLSNISVGKMPLKVQDTVELTLGTRDKSKPRAISAKRVSCAPRNQQEVSDFLDVIAAAIMTADNEHIMALIACHVSWICVCDNYYMNISENLDALLYFVIELSKHRRNLRQHIDNFYRSIYTSKFFDFEKGHFCKLLKMLNTTSEVGLFQKIKQVLIIFLEAVPAKAKTTLKFAKCLLRGDGKLEKFLAVILEKAITGDLAVDSVNDLSWNEIPSVPSQRDLLDDSLLANERLLAVKAKGAYASFDDYMDTYFRLLWADGFYNLQQGVQKLLKGQLDHRDMHVYHSVSLVGVCLPHFESDIMLQLQVTHHNKLINWESTSALMFGNLLCLSATGNFKDAIYATVGERDIKELKKKGLVKIHLLSECNTQCSADVLTALLVNSGHILMVESPTYYRAYQPVYRALQSFQCADLPFQDEIICCRTPTNNNALSPFAKKCVKENISSGLPYLSSWFSGEDREKYHAIKYVDSALKSLNVSPDQWQLKAIKHALVQRFACIQGPPGTGKTFAGILITRILLHSQSDANQKPILVLTYKNHALDEFLKQILRFYPQEVARIGGRCKDPELEDCTLGELKKRNPFDRNMRQTLQDLGEKLTSVKKAMKTTLLNLRSRTVVSHQSFAQYMPLDSCANLLFGFLINKQQKDELSPEEKNLIPFIRNNEFDHYNFEDSLPFQQAFKQWLPDLKLANNIEEMFMPFFNRNKTDNTEESLSTTVDTDGKNSDSDSDEEDELEEERKHSDEKAMRSSKDDVLIQLQWTKSELRTHRLLTTAEKLVADKPIQIYHSINPWSLTPIERMILIQWMLLRQTDMPRQSLEALISEHQRLCNMRRELDAQRSVHILSKMKVVGMTITGASLYHEILAGLSCDITLVEEAAEILEPQLIAALGPWTKHLILIGDHQQLRPAVESYHLVRNYNFDISLMERMINNGLPYESLNMQNRMRPEFASLLLDIYPSIQNNLSRVLNNKAPSCMRKSMFFWDHNNIETKARSVTNKKEAEMVVQLALFFLLHGFSPSQVTIIAAYQGQTGLIRKLIKQAEIKYPYLFPDMPNNDADLGQKVALSRVKLANSKKTFKMRLHVQTIDMYQGDENDIIIVSLVRCNNNRKLGFLNTLNRRCVAQSRAKCGMYLVGSRNTLSSCAHWHRLISKMEEVECVGNSIALCCPSHYESFVTASQAADIPMGSFCKVPCKALMECNEHCCQKTCHPYHDHRKCQVIENVRLKSCGHYAKKKCYENEKDVECTQPCRHQMLCRRHLCDKHCNPQHSHFFCTSTVDVKLRRCGHVATKMCSQQEEEVSCNTEVTFLFAQCGHRSTRLCCEDAATKVCQFPCSRQIECGHPCTNKCGQLCVAKEKCKQCKKLREIEMEKLRQAEEALRKTRLEEAERELAEFKQKPMNDGVIKCELSPNGEKSHLYNKLKDMVNKYIQADHKWKPMVTKIEEVINHKLELGWRESKLSMFDPTYSDLKFHGTSAEAIDAIIESGFILPKTAGMYGKGVYFATDSSKSAQKIYTKGSNMLLVCDVLLGKPLIVEKADHNLSENALKKKYCDSVYARRDTNNQGGVKFDEFIIYNPKRALPKYIIHYLSETM